MVTVEEVDGEPLTIADASGELGEAVLRGIAQGPLPETDVPWRIREEVARSGAGSRTAQDVRHQPTTVSGSGYHPWSTAMPLPTLRSRHRQVDHRLGGFDSAKTTAQLHCPVPVARVIFVRGVRRRAGARTGLADRLGRRPLGYAAERLAERTERRSPPRAPIMPPAVANEAIR